MYTRRQPQQEYAVALICRGGTPSGFMSGYKDIVHKEAATIGVCCSTNMHGQYTVRLHGWV